MERIDQGFILDCGFVEEWDQEGGEAAIDEEEVIEILGILEMLGNY